MITNLFIIFLKYIDPFQIYYGGTIRY